MINPTEFMQQIEEAAGFIQTKFGDNPFPNVGLVLGTGLGDLIARMENQLTISYSDIPHFPRSSVESHAGHMVIGTLAGKSVVALQGRVHAYEGLSTVEVTFPIRLLRFLGVKILILTNAAGGLNTQFAPGNIMAVTDHINMTGMNPLVGPNLDEFGERFPDMTHAYDEDLLELARSAALEEKIHLQSGVYVSVLGPSMETPAETRMLRMIGADAVGMSTVSEVIVGVHAGLRILVISAITNVNRPDCMEPAPLETIIANAGAAGTKIARVIEGVLSLLPSA